MAVGVRSSSIMRSSLRTCGPQGGSPGLDPEQKLGVRETGCRPRQPRPMLFSRADQLRKEAGRTLQTWSSSEGSGRGSVDNQVRPPSRFCCVSHSDKVLGVDPEVPRFSWRGVALRLFRIYLSRRSRRSTAGSVSMTALEATADFSAASFSRRSFLNRTIFWRSASASALCGKSVFWCRKSVFWWATSAETKSPMIVFSPRAFGLHPVWMTPA
jgi:hypothetical protein